MNRPYLLQVRKYIQNTSCVYMNIRVMNTYSMYVQNLFSRVRFKTINRQNLSTVQTFFQLLLLLLLLLLLHILYAASFHSFLPLSSTYLYCPVLYFTFLKYLFFSSPPILSFPSLSAPVAVSNPESSGTASFSTSFQNSSVSEEVYKERVGKLRKVLVDGKGYNHQYFSSPLFFSRLLSSLFYFSISLLTYQPSFFCYLSLSLSLSLLYFN